MRAPIRSLTGAFLVFGAAAAFSACNNRSTPTLSLPSLPFSSAAQTIYSGTITDSVYGPGTVTMSVSSSDSLTGGTWTATFPGQQSRTRFISGTRSGSAYSATVSDCVETDFESCFPNCRQTFTGTLTTGGLSGNYVEVPGDSCTAHSGSVNATHQ